MRTVVVFDFDGTITRKDTFLAFIKFVRGNFLFYKGFLLYSPLLIAYKFGLYPNWKLKQKIFSYFFKGMNYSDFCQYGVDFNTIISGILKEEQLKAIKYHREKGNTIYVISASIREWIEPWCNKNGITNVLSTTVEVDCANRLTGNFLSKNCYGSEKVKRLLLAEPDRGSYYLIVYGDSNGDKELMSFSDEKIWCK